MELAQTGALLTRRLRLRRFTPDDAPRACARWAGDAFNSRFAMARPDAAQTRRALDECAAPYSHAGF